MMDLVGGSHDRLRPAVCLGAVLGLGGRILTGFLSLSVFERDVSCNVGVELSFEPSDTVVKNRSAFISARGVSLWQHPKDQAMFIRNRSLPVHQIT